MSRPGRLVAVVGPSGVGKDSLIDALVARHPVLLRARRVITRDPDAGGEAFDAVDEVRFRQMAADGAFALWWQAHGLFYGLRCEICDRVAAGDTVVANLSRGVLAEAAVVFPGLTVLSVTAAPEVLARRLAARGRESARDIAGRLSRGAVAPPGGVPVTEIDNSGELETTVAAALRAIQPVRA